MSDWQSEGIWTSMPDLDFCWIGGEKNKSKFHAACRQQSEGCLRPFVLDSQPHVEHTAFFTIGAMKYNEGMVRKSIKFDLWMLGNYIEHVRLEYVLQAIGQ
jgi:hypothetical protein